MAVFICGDSFCVSDPEYGVCWADIISQKFDTVNLGQVSASNLVISRQVDQAINSVAEFIIVHCTSCTRDQTYYKGKLVPFSYITASELTTPFDQNKLRILKEYYVEFFDLELAIYQNECILSNMLQRLVDYGKPFLFDQGGFEHPMHGNNVTTKSYFKKYNNYRSDINLWDYAAQRNFRPYYHITDSSVHRTVADYYIKEIEKKL